MRVCGFQFQGSEDIARNTAICVQAVARAKAEGADLLILPEASFFLRQQEAMPTQTQSLDGAFVQALADASQNFTLTVVAGIFEPADDGRAFNTLVVLQEGALIAQYRKLHLYDAFAVKESERIAPGEALPPIFTCAGVKVGLMTCYDVRFPEIARFLAEQGAQLLAIPAAWFAGAHKCWHWEVLTTARALENGVYVAAVDMCGDNRIGLSRFIDPLGVCRAQLAEAEGLFCEVVDVAFLEQVRREMPLLEQRRFSVHPRF